ncbi:Na+/H+ antiporter NhaC family protein [Lutispora sp.]|nr:Na+/H+ antiporter NhaC family protein [Lutispora sp.]MEA4961545.1 Na+/H+ antiporter NhaC family protein [Lutispora sp.]
MAFFKITPIFLLAGLMISGMDLVMAAPLATIYAAVVAAITEKHKYDEIMENGFTAVKEMIVVFFILMFAYAVAETFMATGVGASIIIISLKLGVTAKSVAVVGFMVTAFLSIATGTSWGTFASCAPVFLWLNHIVGGNVLLTVAAIAGGSCFGDNIGLISDTTVVSSGLQKVNVTDRVRHQGVWSAACLVIAGILFYVVGLTMGLPSEVGSAAEAINQITPDVFERLAEVRPAAVTLLEQVRSGVPYYMVIPMIIVIAVAFKGVPTMICLGTGIVSALIFGLFAGTVESISSFLELVQAGFESAGSWSVVMMLWIGAFGGIMRSIKAFEPISNFVLKISRNVKQLMFYNGIMCLIGNAALADEMAQIVTIGPIIKEMTDENVEASEEDMYKLRLRNSTFSDAMGVFGSQLVPWHCYMGFYVAVCMAVYPLHAFTPFDIMKYNFMAFVAVFSILLLTITGWDRFIPLFKLPSEPQVRLKGKSTPAKTRNVQG